MATPGRRRRSSGILSMLLEKANVQGFLTTDDLIEIYPDAAKDSERLETVMLALRRRGVDILDQEADIIEEDLHPPSDLNPYADLTPISSDDTIGLYLKEMARVALLTVEEEICLAKKIELGRASRIRLERSNGRLSAEQRREIEALKDDGDLAREHLIKANTRLVVSIAKRYVGPPHNAWRY